ncbi:MAG: ribonuclease P protein component [Candidatus Saccharimonadales bacterium]
MLAAKFRFHGRTVFHWLHRNSQSARTSSLAVRYKKHALPNYRAAVVVARKVSKSAVVRNRIRRRVYAQIAHLETTKMQNYSFVITAYNDSLANIPTDALKKEVALLLEKAGFGTHSGADKTAKHAIVKREGV